ncbi:hypothetical protein BGZ70_003734 [Mortierella alpina]|uniref:Uncharacterized protein n=1 Tax=Mortierella alpina TaxID=64518 RepID=A0A9P6JAI2_MORAP|nr:hypothetical protein BGZ70_003734 [Mortierella alpina]
MTSRHHHLVRPTLSLATFILPETLVRPVLLRQLILRRLDARLVRSRSTSHQPFSTTCVASNSTSTSSAKTAVPRTPSNNTTRRATQYNVYDTRRVADRSKQTSPKKDSSRNTTSSNSSNNKWDAKADKEIIRLHESGMPWADIDATLNRPPSSCYYRYHTSLDPHLEAWKLSNGQPNVAMIKRLVYLVEVEKHTFWQIQDRKLMHQPWQTPTAFAPKTVLEAFATSEAQSSSSGPTATLDSAAGAQKKDDSHIVFNKIALHKKYTDYKALQAAASLRENQDLYHKALRRGVEVYGENWKKVTECADSLLQQWLPSTTRVPLTPNKVASDFRNLQRQGVEWGLEDDVVMARKILQLKKDTPGIWSILERPLQGQDDDQRRYWSEISLALGNHSPEQCKRRWDGLLQLADEEKSAQSKSWHRFERFQFWMLWKHFYLQNLHLMRKDYPLNDVLELSRACGKLSFSKEISKWMRHRNKAMCEKYFRSSVNSALALGINPTDLEKYLLERRQRLQREKQNRQQQQQQQQEKQEPQEQRDQNAMGASSTMTRAKLGESILLQVAEPTMAKMSTISSENERSTRKDLHQRMVRSDWTVERTRALHEVVLQQKQGVQRADFELDWDRIAEQLEDKFADKSPADRMTLADPAVASTPTTTDDFEVPSRTNAQPMHQQLQLPPPLFTPKQCQSCWEYISSFAPSLGTNAAAPLPVSPSSPLSALGPAEGVGEAAIPFRSSSSSSSDRGYDGRDWSDHELLLLQQGVRKHGTSWADVRAQFLPSRSVSDLYQTWLSISVPGTAGGAADKEGSEAIFREGGNVMVADRLSEPDYVGLLSALEKAGGGGTTAGGEESGAVSNANSSAGNKEEK